MDERKYWVFRVYNTPDAILHKLTTLVTTNGLRDRIPSYCLEKFVHKKGQHEFFLFLSIVTDDQDYIPQEIKEALSYANINTLVAEYPLKYDEIRPMARPETEIEVGSYARRIHYHPPQISRPDNPFDFSMTSEPDSVWSGAYNRLLYWMSAVGKGTWQLFREACGSLGLSNFAETRHIFRRLRLLGHVEYLNDGTHWMVCPTCLVKTNAQHDWGYFLSGAQVPTLIDKLRNVAPVEIRDNHGGPTSVFVMLESESDAQERVAFLQESYRQLRYAGLAGEKLAAILPDLDGWYGTVLTDIWVAGERYGLERWDGQDFRTWGASSTETGMYRLSDLVNPKSDIRYYYYFDADRNCWLQGDWYGLKFLANHHLGIQAEFTYEPQLRQLYVPSADHLPDLYERSLVLASGKLPSPADDGLIYENINEALAETIRSKLYAQLSRGV